MATIDHRICKVCGLEKPISDFYICDRYNDIEYHSLTCKKCTNTSRREYYKQYCNKNRDKLNKYHSEYLKCHRDKYSVKQKEWKQKNAKRIRKVANKYFNERRRKDELFAFSMRVRNLIRNSFNRTVTTKRGKTEGIVGCDIETLRGYLLKTWKSNYGTEWNGEPYHIDHIIPLATAKTEQDVIELCHYTNLQLLKPKDNLKKGVRTLDKRTL